MSIIRKVKSVERLFGHLELEITEFKAQTGLFCVSGCGKCCTKPDIDATPLEFLPLAFHLFMNGKAQEMLAKLEQEISGICVIYNPLSVGDKINGQCSEYPFRGLICRLFGYGASRDKLGELRLATCKIIKEGQADNYDKVAQMISQKMYVPVFSDYYMRLAQIDFKMGNAFLPINEALKRAIEEVLHYYAYRPFPKGMKTVA